MDNISHNFAQIKAHAATRGCKVMAVLKANAYGHGAVQVARLLIAKHQADFFAVATLPEAIELRQGVGEKVSILCLGATVQAEWPIYDKYRVDMMVGDADMVSELTEWCLRANLAHGVRVHVMLNTGMSRMGLQAISQSVSDMTPTGLPRTDSERTAEVYHGVAANAAADVVQAIHDTPDSKLQLVGMCTHMSEANRSSEGSNHTSQQFRRFQNIVRAVRDRGIEVPMLHAENSESLLASIIPPEEQSALLFGHEETSLGYCRTGGAIYGQRDHQFLKPCITLKAQVRHLHIAQKGTPVGYDRSWCAKEDCRIATLAVGFADGYSRYNSNQGSVSLHGERYEIAGKVCMDMMMVNLGDPDGRAKDVKVGDYAVLYGDNGPPLKEVAALLDTAQSDITCVLGRRVLRKYVGDV